MSLGIAPVSYKRLLTTVSQQLQLEETTKTREIMKDSMRNTDADNFLVDHSYVSKKTNFLDILDEDTLLQLAYELGLDKKSELPELKDIEISIDYCAQMNTRAEKRVDVSDTSAGKIIQR